MEKKTDEVFNALFKLEEIRQILRDSLPTGLDNDEKEVWKSKLSELNEIVQKLDSESVTKPLKKIAGTIEIRNREENYINIQPIQAAGRLTLEGRKAIIAYGDGYSTCDACRKPFRLDKISKPPIGDFHTELAQFVNMDQARVVPGARRGFQAVAQTVVNKGDSVIVSSFAHYTEFLAVEGA